MLAQAKEKPGRAATLRVCGDLDFAERSPMHTILHDQLDLFAPERWPRRPYCTDDLAAGLRIRSLSQALTRPYIQANPPHLRCWSIFDLDRAGAALAWEDADLPPPTWAAVNRENGHAHLVYGLSAPVLLTDGSQYARQGPVRKLEAVESAIRAKLEADPGFAGLITKNPAHPLWRVLRGPRIGYELDELEEWIPDLERYTHKRGKAATGEVRVGVGRNVELFDRLRFWAYVEIRAWLDASGLQAWNEWHAHMQARAALINIERFGNRALDPREAWHVGRSVAKWVWRNGRDAVQRSNERFSALQRNRRKGQTRDETKELEQWLLNTR